MYIENLKEISLNPHVAICFVSGDRNTSNVRSSEEGRGDTFDDNNSKGFLSPKEVRSTVENVTTVVGVKYQKFDLGMRRRRPRRRKGCVTLREVPGFKSRVV